MGILVVSVLLVLAVTISAHSLRALMSGTNISDWEIAHQAAESGLENALLYLAGKSDPDLTSDNNVSRPVYPGAAKPSSASEYFIRRNMTKIGQPGDPGEESNPPYKLDDSSYLQNNQYWNYKIYRTSDSCPRNNYKTYNNTPFANYWPIVPAPAYPNNPGQVYNIDNGNYITRLNLKGSWTSDAGLSTPISVDVKYWEWTDSDDDFTQANNINQDNDDDGYNDPVDKNGTPIAPTGEKNIDWETFSGTGKTFSELILAGGGYYYNYYFRSYVLVIPNGGTDGSLTLTESLDFAKTDCSFKTIDYFIDAVGMFGEEKAKVRAVFDPEEKTFWRVNFY